MRRTASLIAALGTLVACSGTDGTATPDTASPFSTTIPTPTADGVLRLGLLIPQSGDGAALGEPLIAVAESAVAAINAAGGVSGRPVELVIADEGPDITAALSAVDALVNDEGVDAVVGPLSSNVALEVVPRLVEYGVGVCSPAATAVALSELPDDDLFVRTSASDGLAGQAVAQLVAQTGVSATVLAYPDDPFGRDLSTAIERSLALQGIAVTNTTPYDPTDSDYGAQVDSIPAGGVITLVGDSESGGRFLRTLLSSGAPNTIVVNDAFADVDLTDAPELFASDAPNVIGVALDSFAGSAGVVDYLDPATSAPPLGAAMIDCVNLLAVASEFAASDVAAEFMPQVIAASRGGSACVDFATCLAIIESGLNIDYNGPTGVLSLDANGDPSIANFVTFGFDADGRPSFRGALGVFSAP